MKSQIFKLRLSFGSGLFFVFFILFCRCKPDLETEHTVARQYPVEPPVYSGIIRESRQRPDLLDENSPKGLNVVQITTNPAVGSHNVYTEA